MSKRIHYLILSMVLASAAQTVMSATANRDQAGPGEMKYVPSPKYFGASKPTPRIEKGSPSAVEKSFDYKPNAKYLPPKQDHKAGD